MLKLAAWPIYIAAGLKRFGERSDRLAIAAVMPPMFGSRAGEALSRRVRDIDRGRVWRLVIDQGDEAGVPRVCPHSMRGFYASAGVSSGALPHVIAANMGRSSFTITAQHYAKPEAIAQAHSARVFDLLDLEQGADALAQLPAETLIAKLPPETLARIVEKITQRNEGNGGADAPTGIRTESVPAVSKSAISRQKN